MLAPTIRAIASQNSRNIRANKPLSPVGQYVTGAADVFDLRVFAGNQIELAPQVAHVELDRPDFHDVGARAARRPVAGAAQDRPDTRHQFARVEWLGEIIVCAE